MNKLTFLSLISALSCSPLVHAGGMGNQGLTGTVGFLSLEGGYAVSSMSNYNYTILGPDGGSITSVISKQHYAGRLAGGLINMMDDQFAVTSELGWGYYGRVTLDPPSTDFGALTIQHTITGFDALMGIAFIQPSYSISFKAGAMIQNLTTKTTAFSDLAFIDLGIGSFESKVNQTAALPEIKIGGSYNFDNSWSVTAAYLVAFGSSSRGAGSIDPDTGVVTITSNNLNPTISAFLLGVQFTC